MKNFSFNLKNFSVLNRTQTVFILIGLLMIFCYSFSSLLSNTVSTYAIGYTSSIYILCCFILFFLKFLIKNNVSIVKADESSNNPHNNNNSNAENSNNGNPKPSEPLWQNSEVYSINENPKIELLFKPIKFLTILYIFVNIGSVAYAYVKPEEEVVVPAVTRTELLQISSAVAKVENSRFDITSYVVNTLKIVNFKPANSVLSFQMDSLQPYTYYIDFSVDKKILNKKIQLRKLYIANYTECEVKNFCGCPEGNPCLKNTTIDLFILPQKKDTFYFMRLFPKNKLIEN